MNQNNEQAAGTILTNPVETCIDNKGLNAVKMYPIQGFHETGAQ